jgi:nucleotidyltransferase substrate binding protein (TIGR01987 family)
LREAFAMAWLADEEAWLAMLADRNLTSHTYDEELAQAVYSRLGAYLPLLKDLQTTLADLE